MGTFDRTDRTTIRRLPERGRYDRETVYGILDEALICHVGFVRDGSPVVIPTIHARLGDVLYLHGSTASGALAALRGGAEACVTVTIVDGLVLARSAFHHSMNYRSVAVFGCASVVTESEEKLHSLRALVEHVATGRWDEARAPNPKELAATLVLRIPLEEASAKIRTGPPVDDEEDYALPIWAGVLPLETLPQKPVPDPRLPAGVPLARSAKQYGRQ